QFKSHDVTIVVSISPGPAYIIESPTPLRIKDRYAPDGDGTPQGKIYELGAKPHDQPATGYTRLVPDSPAASVASIRRQGNQLTLSLLHANQAEDIAP